MDYTELTTKFHNRLSSVYDERERRNILRIYIEDKGIKFPLMHEEAMQVEKDISRLADHVPIQYITGISIFYDLELRVSEDVLIPRPETEEMVFLALEEISETHKSVIDIGTGSGCIALLLKSQRQELQVTAVDKSKRALKVAMHNAEMNQLDINLSEMDLLDSESWPDERYDVIVSNPPYIPYSEKNRMSKSTIRYEPDEALYVSNERPVIMYERILNFAELHLNAKGMIFLELNDSHVKNVFHMYENAMFLTECQVIKDLQGFERFLIARKG